MKGIVVEIRGDQAVIVDKKGNFHQQKVKMNADVGQEVEFSNNVTMFNSSVFRTMSAIAASFLIMLGIGSYAYMTPYSYVSLDINPSVEIVLNRFERVLDVKPLNEDAKKIIDSQKKYTNQTLDGTIIQLVNKAKDENYISDNGTGEVLITVSSPKQTETAAIEQIVENKALPQIKDKNIQANINVEDVTMEKHEQAQKLQVTPGKLILLEKLKEVNPSVDLEQVKMQSVKEIMQTIKNSKEKKTHDQESVKDSAATGPSSDTSETASNKENNKNETKEDYRSSSNSQSSQGGLKGANGQNNKDENSNVSKDENKYETENHDNNSNKAVSAPNNNTSNSSSGKKSSDNDKKEEDDKQNGSNNDDKKDVKDSSDKSPGNNEAVKDNDKQQDDKKNEVKENSKDKESNNGKDEKKSDKTESTKQKGKGSGKDK